MSGPEWHSPEPDEAEWIAPNTGSEAEPVPEPVPADHLPDYTAASPEEREAVLRHADSYLYGMNHREAGASFRGEKSREIFRPTLVEQVRGVFAKRVFSTSAKDLLSPLDYAYSVARDDKKWQELVEKERTARSALDTVNNQQGLGIHRDINPKRLLELAKYHLQSPARERELTRAALFRTAIELRKETLELLAEQVETSPERSAEIDAALNEKYASLMAMAHTRSWELQRKYKERDVKGNPNFSEFQRSDYGLRSLTHWTKKREAKGSWKWRGNKSTWKQEQVSDATIQPNLETAFGPNADPRVYEQDKSAKHQEWVNRTIAAEQAGHLPTGFERAITSEGELTSDNIAEVRRQNERAVALLDYLSRPNEIDANELKSLFGIDIKRESDHKTKQFSYYSSGQNKKKITISAAPRREIAVDLGNGRYATMTIEHGGFLTPKKDSNPAAPAFEEQDGKIVINSSPSRDATIEQLLLRITSVKYRNNLNQTEVTQALINPTPEQLRRSPEYQQIAQTLRRAEEHYTFKEADAVMQEASEVVGDLEKDVNRYQLEIEQLDQQIAQYHDSLKREPRWTTMTDVEKMAALQRVPSNIRREIELRNSAIKSCHDKANRLSKAMIKVATARAQHQTEGTREAAHKLAEDIKRITTPES